MEVEVTEDTGANIPQINMEDNLVDDTNDGPRNSTARDPVLYEARAIGLSGHTATIITAQIKEAKARIIDIKKQAQLKGPHSEIQVELD